MKKLSFLVLAVAGMLFAACSSDKDAANDTPNPNETLPEGYLAVNINLPTQPQSLMRAANDNYDDGITAEYNVMDCALLLFQCASDKSEADATLINAQPIMLSDKVEDADYDNITTSYKTVAKVEDYTPGNKLFALAMVNYKNIMSISDGVPTIAGTELAKGKKLADLRAIKTSAAMSEETLTTRSGSQNYFFMTNAVFSSVAGGKTGTPAAANIYQLASLDPSKIKATETEAKNNPAGDIIVERAVAKATLTLDAGANMVGARDIATDGVTWAIDNMEPISYVVRNPGDAEYIGYIGYSSEAFSTAYYRFVGNTSVKTDKTPTTNTLIPTSDAYRTYWCVDPQYSQTTDPVGMKQASRLIATSTSGSDPLYCFENTFTVANQNYKNTTRAVIKVTLADIDDIFTINGVEFTQTAAESYLVDNIVNNTNVLKAFKDGLKEGQSYTVKPATFTVTYSRDNTTGKHIVATLALNEDEIDSKIGTVFVDDFKTNTTINISTVLSNAKTTANDEVEILQYKNGEMWYTARFEHLANTAHEKTITGDWDSSAENDAITNGVLAPWNCWETGTNKPSAGTTTATAYPGTNKDQNYLGRYGMVRNNWYDVTITKFNKLGSPVDPRGTVSSDDTPDDNIQEYISARIHVLSWAKRTQGWSF